MNTNSNLDIKRITCVTGHFGSGKTEFAINYALELKKLGKDVVIIDFDIVNPYFRTKDAENVLKSEGIKVISPEFANLNIESPSLPPDIYSAFSDDSKHIIFDVGGDDDGATPLGVYYEYFKDIDYDLFFVLNERRLMTQTVEDALDIFNKIKHASRLNPTGIISNAHLMSYTDNNIIIKGSMFAQEFSKNVGLPIKYITVTDQMFKKINSNTKISKNIKEKLFPMNLFVGTTSRFG